ncbi:hypothetical protein [Nocardia testacea]|uniref:hypothetical protein n=1 Tax=Nocardia testacea TaxID=248551 RepID=UPI003410868D
MRNSPLGNSVTAACPAPTPPKVISTPAEVAATVIAIPLNAVGVAIHIPLISKFWTPRFGTDPP